MNSEKPTHIPIESPHFMIIGAAKAGTTTLYDDLAGHPHTYMPDFKEPDILHQSDTPAEVQTLYQRHFARAEPGQICGEASTYYTMLPTFPGVAQMAREVCGPKLKIIYIMRDPMARLKSHLAHDIGAGRLKHHDFARAVREDPRYQAWSDYPRQIAPWLDAFDPSCFLFLSFETFTRTRSASLKAVCAHLGIDPELAPQRTDVSNQRGSQRQLRLPLLGRAVRSDLYQNGLRRLLPRGVIEGGKTLLSARRHVPDITFTAAEAEAIAAPFAGQRAALERLGIQTVPGLQISPAAEDIPATPTGAA